MGKSIAAMDANNGVSNDNSILYVVLQIFGLGIVNYALIQNEINKKVVSTPTGM